MKQLFREAEFSEEQAELRSRMVHSFVNGDRCFPDTCEAKKTTERQMIIKVFVAIVCTPHQKFMSKMLIAPCFLGAVAQKQTGLPQ